MAFDSDLVAAAAADRQVTVAALEGALADLQGLVAGHTEVGGVDGLVYEWRQAYRHDPLLERTPDRYYLAVAVRVWTDFEQRLEFEEPTAAAVREVHARATRRAVGSPERGAPMVLERG